MSDWDAELKKIDKQLESMSDSALIPAAPKGAPPAAKAQVAAERATTRTWGAFQISGKVFLRRLPTGGCVSQTPTSPLA